MASIDVYVNPWLTGQIMSANSLGGLTQGSGTQGQIAKKLAPNFTTPDGVHIRRMYATWVKGTESDGTIYRVFRDLPGNLVPLSVRLACQPNAGMTSVSCGLYKAGNIVPGGPIGTPALNANCFANAVNIAAGAASLKEATAFDMLALGGLANPNNLFTRIFEYAGENIVNRYGQFDLALTLNTGGATGGTWMAMLVEYILG